MPSRPPSRQLLDLWRKRASRIDQGLLIIAGERKSDLPEESDKVSIYVSERFAGSFKRVVSLPEGADPSRVEARYRDGVLRVSAQRRESAQPKRLEIK